MAVKEPETKRQAQRTYTVDDLPLLESEGKRYELINGELEEMSPASETHGVIAAEILRIIANFVREHKLGRVFAAETGFQLSDKDRIAPDVSFIAAARLKPQETGFAVVCPDLAVEVDSPSNMSVEYQQQIAVYFKYGAKQVWLVYPKSRTFYLYTAEDQVAILGQDKVIDASAVLPGFTLKVSDIFSVLDEQ